MTWTWTGPGPGPLSAHICSTFDLRTLVRYLPTDRLGVQVQGTGVQGPSLSTTDTDYYRLDVTDKHAMIDRIGRSSRRQTDTAGLPGQENMHSVATVAVPIHLLCELTTCTGT
jgi:hypothetical protein